MKPTDDIDNSDVVSTHGPIHEFFELTYASYLVLPRSILQSAPVEWQQRFVGVLNELETMFDMPSDRYAVSIREHDGRLARDPLAAYERGRRRVPMKRV